MSQWALFALLVIASSCHCWVSPPIKVDQFTKDLEEAVDGLANKNLEKFNQLCSNKTVQCSNEFVKKWPEELSEDEKAEKAEAAESLKIAQLRAENCEESSGKSLMQAIIEYSLVLCFIIIIIALLYAISKLIRSEIEHYKDKKENDFF